MTAVCFDLDGTLYDDRSYVKAGFRNAAVYLRSRYGIETFDDMVWEYAVKRNFETVFDHILTSYEIPETELADLIAAYHSGTPDISLYPETETVLSTLPDSCRTAVITGGKHGRQKLQLLGINDAFDEVYVTPDNDTSKRESAPFETVLDVLGVDPQQAVFVGDNPELDFYWPNTLGMTTVWVRRPHTLFGSSDSPEARPDYVLPDLSLVPEIVATVLNGAAPSSTTSE